MATAAVDRRRGKGTPAGDAYPECAMSPGQGIERHRREDTSYCRSCRAYNAQRSRIYRARRAQVGTLKVASLGSQRRIRALMRMGWPQQTLEKRWGLGHKTLTQVMLRDVITREKALLIARGYRDIVAGGLAGPDRRTRAWAERRGWAGPTDWDDIDSDAEVVASLIVDRDHAEGLRLNREIDKMLAKRAARAVARERRAVAARQRRGVGEVA